jgi:hypothetical protein
MSKKKSNMEMQINEDNQIKKEYKEVTLLKNPIIILSTSLKMLLEQITKSIKFLLTHKKILTLLIIILFSTLFDGPHIRVILFKN